MKSLTSFVVVCLLGLSASQPSAQSIIDGDGLTAQGTWRMRMLPPQLLYSDSDPVLSGATPAQALEGSFLVGALKSPPVLSGSGDWFTIPRADRMPMLTEASQPLLDMISPIASGNAITDGPRFSGVGVSPIPEPSTYALWLAGLATVGFIARRRSKP